MTSMMTARRGVMAKPTTLNPTSIAGLQAWYDASAVTGLSDGDPVASLADLSGNSRSATQSTSASKPTYKTAIQNGKPVVRFDGVDDYLKSSSFAGPTTGLTVFLVHKFRTATSNGVAALQAAADGSWNSPYAQWAIRASGATLTSQEWVGSAGSAFVSPATDMDVFHVHTLRYDQTVPKKYLDGTLSATAGGPTGALTPTTASIYFGTNPTVAELAAMDLGEHLVYHAALSTTDRQAVEAYLKAKWGTP